MTDRELLELAAKAAGIEVRWHEAWECFVHVGEWANGRPLMHRNQMTWGPLSDDGDALRLAADMGIDVTYKAFGEDEVMTSASEDQFDGWFTEPYGADKRAATRRAIVRAAAAIGEDVWK